MKILAINGSPNREGSTANLIDILLDECKNLGAECNKINIEDYNTTFCQECGKCYKCTSLGACSIDDDFSQLKALMLDSDGIVIGTPYYSGRPVEQLEAFLSRMSLCTFANKEFVGKQFVGLCTSAVDDGMSVAKYCANLGMDATKGGYNISGLLSETTVLEEGLKDLHLDTDIRSNAKRTAQKLISDIKTKKSPWSSNVKSFIFSGKLNYMIIKSKRVKKSYSNSVHEYLKEKGLVKNS